MIGLPGTDLSSLILGIGSGHELDVYLISENKSSDVERLCFTGGERMLFEVAPETIRDITKQQQTLIQVETTRLCMKQEEVISDLEEKLQKHPEVYQRIAVGEQ